MPTNQNHIQYLPATLKRYKSGYQIEYYVENPSTNKLSRKVIKVNKVFSRHHYKRDALMHINSIIKAINDKLATGYNPFFDGEDSRLYTPMRIVFEQYISEKERECRPDTMRSYKSFINQFHRFILANSTINYISMANHALVARYMDYYYNTRGVSNRTYNNQLKMGRAFFNWCIDKCYVKGNPFDKIKVKKKQQKKRTIIDKKTRQKITDYLVENNDNLLIVCKLMYYSLIRPKEILMIKIKHIDLDKHYIYIPGENAKNHNARYAALTPDLVNELQFIKDTNPEMLLFSSNLKTGYTQHTTRMLTKRWHRLRQKLKLEDNLQLYSFRDTGIYEMLKAGVDNLTVMQHADHYSLDMTTIYANHADQNLTDKIYNNAPEF